MTTYHTPDLSLPSGRYPVDTLLGAAAANDRGAFDSAARTLGIPQQELDTAWTHACRTARGIEDMEIDWHGAVPPRDIARVFLALGRAAVCLACLATRTALTERRVSAALTSVRGYVAVRREPGTCAACAQPGEVLRAPDDV